MEGWISPRLGVRFELPEEGLEIYRPDGEKFLSPSEINAERLLRFALTTTAKLRISARRIRNFQRAEQEFQRAEQEALNAQQEAQKSERLAAKLPRIEHRS